MKKSEIEEEFDEKAHAALIKGLHKLDGKNEKSGREKVVRLNSEAIPSVNTKSFLKKIGNEFLVDAPKELSSLPKPLEKPAAKRLKRATGYEEVAIDVNKWESIVNQRRKAEQLTFPLHQADVRVVTSEKNFKPSMKSNLEKEVYALLSGAKLQDEKQETEEEQEVQKAMSLKEIRLRSKEIWRARILRQRIEKKAALLNKSKSRKYHRILRRERLRRQKENFERLRHVDPKSALEILNQIEKERINERMSLRHKKSKWLETQRTRAGQDPEARSALQQNAEIRNDLLEKLKKCEKEQDDDEGILQEQEELIKKGVLDPANAWVSQMARASKDEDGSQDLGFLKMKNFWEDVHQRKVVEKEAQKVVEELEKKAKKKQRVEDKKVEKLKEEEFGGGSSEENSTKTAQEQSSQKKMQTQLKCGPEKNTKKDTKKKKTNETDYSRSRKIDEEKMNKDDEDDQEPLEKILETIQEANIDSVSKKNKKADKNKREIEKIKTREERETEEPQRKKVEGIQANKEDKLKKKKAIGKDNNLKIEENKINVDFNGNKKNKKTKTGKKTETKKKSAKKAKKSQTEEEGKQQKKKPGKEKKSSKLKEKSGLVDQVFIDDMFDRAEEKLIKKLGEKATTHLQSREQPDPSQEELPENIHSRDDNLEFDFTVHGNENQIDEGLTRVTTLEDMDSLPAPADSENKLLSKVTTEVAQDSKEMEQPVSIVNVQDGDILKIKSRRLGRSIPDYSHLSRTQPHEDSEEELLEDDLQDLFEEEENIKEFRAEKEAQEESSKLKDVDTFLEGWGGWAGPGIVPSERKKEKFRIKAPKKGPNKYSTVGNVIYNEKTDVHDKIRKVMVNQLPHPFSRVKDFEASIRQPLGRKFVPETVHRKLIAPPVTQKMGVVIAPMDEDVLLKNHQKRKKAVSKIEAKIDEKLKHINGLQENKRNSQTKFKRKKSGRKTLKCLVVHK